MHLATVRTDVPEIQQKHPVSQQHFPAPPLHPPRNDISMPEVRVAFPGPVPQPLGKYSDPTQMIEIVVVYLHPAFFQSTSSIFLKVSSNIWILAGLWLGWSG